MSLFLNKDKLSKDKLRRMKDEVKGKDFCFILHPSSFILCRYPFSFILQKKGFTLIEILVAVTIFSVLLVAIYSTFFLSYKATEGMDESMVKLQEARRALDILKRELDSTFYVPGDQNTFFRIADRDVYGKQATRLEFTAFSPQRPGVSRVIYFIEEKEGKLNLFKQVESPYRKEETEEADIIEDMESFGIEAKYNDTWVKTWDTSINKDVPEEIRINLGISIKGRTLTLSDLSSPKIRRKI